MERPAQILRAQAHESLLPKLDQMDKGEIYDREASRERDISRDTAPKEGNHPRGCGVVSVLCTEVEHPLK